MQRRGTHHNAVDDAESQAWHLLELLNTEANGRAADPLERNDLTLMQRVYYLDGAEEIAARL